MGSLARRLGGGSIDCLNATPHELCHECLRTYSGRSVALWHGQLGAQCDAAPWLLKRTRSGA